MFRLRDIAGFNYSLGSIFAIFMTLVYALAGFYLIFFAPAFQDFGTQYKILFGVVLLIYALFRGIRAFISIKELKKKRDGK